MLEGKSKEVDVHVAFGSIKATPKAGGTYFMRDREIAKEKERKLETGYH